MRDQAFQADLVKANGMGTLHPTVYDGRAKEKGMAMSRSERSSIIESEFTNATIRLGFTQEARDRLLASSPSHDQTAIRVINVHRLLSAAVGNDREAISHWLETYNTGLKGYPMDLIKTAEGLVSVEAYFLMFAGKW